MLRPNLQRSIGRVGGVVLLVLSAVGGAAAFAAQPIGSAAESARAEKDPSLTDLLNRCAGLAVEDRYAEALDGIIAAFETHPDSAWDLNTFWGALIRGFEWFGRLSDDEQERVLARYAKPRSGQGKTQAPLFNQLTDWMHDVLPATSLKSPGGKLALATWYWQAGHHARAVAYGMGVFQTSPDTLAGQTAMMALVAGQYFRCGHEGALRTVQMAVRLAPNGQTTGWGICRVVLYLCDRRQVERAKAFCREVRTAAPGTLASAVADQALGMIGDIEAMAYPQALERMWELRAYAMPGPAKDILGTLLPGIASPTDLKALEAQERVDELTRAAQKEVEWRRDPLRTALAHVVLAHCAFLRAKPNQAVEHYQSALDTNHPDVEEYVLAQLGELLSRSDPPRAIECLERLRRRHGGGAAGWEWQDKALAELYQSQGRYEEALQTYRDLEERCRKRCTLVDVRSDWMSASVVACLRGLGRDQEADDLAEEVLRGHHYDAPIETLTDGQLSDLHFLLNRMGRNQEAEQYRQEQSRRQKAIESRTSRR